MHSFVDAKGREWSVEINVGTARAIRARLTDGPDFLDYAALLVSLPDPFFAADLLFACCGEQAKEREIDAEEFGRGLKGRAIQDATDAFVAEYLDFFPDPTIAEKMRTVVEKQRATQSAILDAICEKIPKKLDVILADAERKLGAPSSNASQSPEETTPPSQV